MSDLWTSDSAEEWKRAADSYSRVIELQGSERLPELDRWYRLQLPQAIRGREPAHVTLEELEQVTRWKMTRGAWRARNLSLVRGNPVDAVREASREALAAIPHPRAPIAALSRLAGVGPATASAVLAAVAPERYPFFDDLVAERVPGLGAVAYTPAYYVRYAGALRERAGELGPPWTAEGVARAVWAALGGKAGATAG